MSSTSNTTSTVTAPTQTNIDAMAKMISEARQMRDWMLISPDGRVWVTDKPEELFAVLAPHHPLLKGMP